MTNDITTKKIRQIDALESRDEQDNLECEPSIPLDEYIEQVRNKAHTTIRYWYDITRQLEEFSLSVSETLRRYPSTPVAFQVRLLDLVTSSSSHLLMPLIRDHSQLDYPLLEYIRVCSRSLTQLRLHLSPLPLLLSIKASPN
jgi:hypothetical protein